MSDDLVADISQLEDRFRKAPESRLFAPLADAYRKSGDLEKAIEICEKGLTRYPDYASAHVILGKCYYDKGATERSRAEFERVMELDPENMVALNFMGDILLAEGKREDAARYYRKLLSIDPTNEAVERSLKELEDEFQSREIDLSSHQAGDEKRGSGELATMTLAGIYAAQGYYSKALRIYGEILQREPGNKEAAAMRARVEKLIEKPDLSNEEPFDDEVMTISTEDVDEETAASTSGHGIAGRREKGLESELGEDIGGSGPEEEDMEEVARELELADEKGKGAKGPGSNGGEPEGAGGTGGKAREGMDDFRRWLQKKQREDEDREAEGKE